MLNFFKGHIVVHALRREIVELYISVMIKNFALSMFVLFEPIYLYDKLGFPLAQVILFFAVAYTLHLFLLPLGGKICARFGFEHSILYSTPLLIIYLGMLYWAGTWRFLIYCAPLVLAWHKTLFWPAYHANFAHYGTFGRRGKEISNLGFLNAFIVVLGPILGGLIITLFNFPVLFVVVALLIMTSVIPLFTTREIFEPSHFGYFHALRRLFKSYYRRYTLGFMGSAEGLVKAVVWPIFIFLILKSYLTLGGLSSIAVFFAAVLGLFLGHMVDREGRRRMLRFSTVVYAVVWFLRLLVHTVTEVFMVDSLSNISATGVNIPLQVLVYDKGRERGNLNFAVLFEMGVTLGKMLIAWVLFLVFLFTPNMGIAFVLAGLASLLYILLK